MSKASYRDMTGPTGLLANRQPFTGNSLRAEWTSMCPSAGRLDPAEHDRLHSDWQRAVDTARLMYVVYSYATPIAWAIAGEEAYCTPQRFSVTTSKGQGYVRAWINHGRDTVSQDRGWGYEAYRAERIRLGI